MKILQNEQPATIYIEGIKYEFENGVLECKDNKKHAEIFKEHNYIVDVVPAETPETDGELTDVAPVETRPKNKRKEL